MNDEQFETIQELLTANYIQISRIYDTITIILDKIGGDALTLIQEHEQGKLLGPDPYLTEEE
jgi:hypothetical protein